MILLELTTARVFLVMSSFLGSITGISLNGALCAALSCWLANLGASVVDINVDLWITDGVLVVDSISVVPLTTDEYEAFGCAVVDCKQDCMLGRTNLIVELIRL